MFGLKVSVKKTFKLYPCILNRRCYSTTGFLLDKGLGEKKLMALSIFFHMVIIRLNIMVLQLFFYPVI